jgi:hypothetical protein
MHRARRRNRANGKPRLRVEKVACELKRLASPDAISAPMSRPPSRCRRDPPCGRCEECVHLGQFLAEVADAPRGRPHRSPSEGAPDFFFGRGRPRLAIELQRYSDDPPQDRSTTSRTRGATVVDSLRAWIARKEAKLPEYRRHADEVWLVMVGDERPRGSSFGVPERIVDHTFESGFDRVYAMNAMPAWTRRLRIVAPRA